MAKKILYAWSDLFFDEDAVTKASGHWPRAFTNRSYSVTDVEQRLPSTLVVASSDCSRCSQTFVVFRKDVSEQKVKATSNQTEPAGTHENAKEMLTAVDTQKYFQ